MNQMKNAKEIICSGADHIDDKNELEDKNNTFRRSKGPKA